MEQEKEEKKEKKELFKEVSEKVEEKIKSIIDSGITPDNIEALGELVDIHKDICNEKYWKKKEEVLDMRYRGYDEYEEYSEGGYGRRGRDSRGRYTGRGRSYQGEEMLEEMREHYGNYSEGGRYGGPEKEKAFDYMLQSAEDFFNHLMQEAEHPEQMEKIKRTAKRISEMRM